jgi:hypothetical protein
MVDVSDVAPASADDDSLILSVSVGSNMAKPAETPDLPQSLTMAALQHKPSGQTLKEEEKIREGVNTIITAMHRWAYESKPEQRSGWLRQVKRLDELGVEFRQDVDNLLEFASSNSNFGQVTRDDLTEIDVVAANSAQQSNFDDRDESSEGDALDRDTAPTPYADGWMGR